MRYVLEKLIFVLWMLLFPMIGLSAAVEVSGKPEEQKVRFSLPPILPRCKEIQGGTRAVSVRHEKIKMCEFMDTAKGLATYERVSVLDFRDAEARPVHLYQLFELFRNHSYLRVLDLRSPDIVIDFYGSDIIGLEYFLERRRKIPFELRIRHNNRFRPFPPLIGAPKSPESLANVICREIVKNPGFSVVIENIPDDFALALFRTQCSVEHGRERLMQETADMWETICARSEKSSAMQASAVATIALNETETVRDAWEEVPSDNA